jgi:DNA repair exonuclease SbcCD ATPase subunit
MSTDTLSVLLGQTLREIHSLSERLARLSANVSVIEKRWSATLQAERRESVLQLRELRRELKALEKKIDTQPIAFRQIMDTWWLRIAAIGLLGLANIDLKEAISLVLR